MKNKRVKQMICDALGSVVKDKFLWVGSEFGRMNHSLYGDDLEFGVIKHRLPVSLTADQYRSIK